MNGLHLDADAGVQQLRWRLHPAHQGPLTSRHLLPLSEMTLTLWRGDELLGELRARPAVPRAAPRPANKPPSLSAFLIPKVKPCELVGVWQIHVPMAGMGVQQHPVAPDIVAQRGETTAHYSPHRSSAAQEPMTAEQAQGVPEERQFTVRDNAGKVYRPLQLRLMESRFEPSHFDDVLREVPGEALIDGSVWNVFVDFASVTDAPAI